MAKTQKLIEILNSNRFFKISSTTDENGATMYHFQVYTPAGRNLARICRQNLTNLPANTQARQYKNRSENNVL